MAPVPWTRQHLLAAFRLYCHTPFGKLHQHNREIQELATRMGRSASSLAMKACNFASLDPEMVARGVTGLSNVSRADRELWDEFLSNPSEIADAAEAAYESITATAITIEPPPPVEALPEFTIPSGPTESLAIVRTRRLQSFFRATVLTGYGYRCAISGITVPELLIASHIIPWSANETRRADPRNGICLNALYDRAFDRGLITFDENLCVVISSRLRSDNPCEAHSVSLLKIEGQRCLLPQRFVPDSDAINYHRQNIFR